MLGDMFRRVDALDMVLLHLHHQLPILHNTPKDLLCVSKGTSTVNKRSGIWNISVNNGLVNLTFVKSVLVGQVVSIRFGAKSRKSVDYSASGIGVGSQKVPEYINVNIDTLQKKIPTTFDTGNTVFINNEDQYLTPFANDRYLKFTKTNIYQ